MSEKRDYKQFLRTILPLAAPIIIQNLLTASLSMLDGIMIAHHGSASEATMSMAAVGQASRIFFVIMLFYFGIAAGASIFFSQFFGKGDEQGVRRILGVSITIGLIISLIPFLGSMFFSRQLMGLFVSSNDQAVITLGAKFLTTLGWSYPVYILSWIYGYALRSIGHPRIYMFASVTALASNAILNYFFIFGNSLIPALGVTGAALGTTISRFIEFGILIIYVYTRKSSPLKASLKEIFAFRFYDVVQYMKTSLPVILEEGLWGAGMTLIYAIFGSLGRTTLAAVSIMGSFIELSFVLFFAISQATNVVMGRMIGAKEPVSDIKWTAWQCLGLGLMGSVIVIILLAFVPYFLIPILYPVDKEAIWLTQRTIWAFEVLFLIRGVQMVGLIGVLRGSGDTLFTMLVDLAGVWLIMVPIVHYTAVILRWSLPFVELASFLSDAFLFVCVLWRISTNKWIKNVTYEIK